MFDFDCDYLYGINENNRMEYFCINKEECCKCNAEKYSIRKLFIRSKISLGCNDIETSKLFFSWMKEDETLRFHGEFFMNSRNLLSIANSHKEHGVLCYKVKSLTATYGVKYSDLNFTKDKGRTVFMLDKNTLFSVLK